MNIIIEFPLQVLNSYNGQDNLDETLDENITWLIKEYFLENSIEFDFKESIQFVKPTPQKNDELVRYNLTIKSETLDLNNLVKKLENKGFEKGLTITTQDRSPIYFDQYTADIQFRRSLGKKKKRFITQV
jgi:hypothetical protein